MDTNIAFDVALPGRKRHKTALSFYQKHKGMTLEITEKILVEINEILAESFASLVTRIRESLMHLDRSGRNWDKLSSEQKRRALIEIEDNINKDKQLIKDNRLDFVLGGYQRLESFFATSNLDEIQEILLHIPEDLSDDIDKKITSLFPPISYSTLENHKAEVRNKLNDEVVSKHFNQRSEGQDNDIMIELIIILAFGAERRTFSKMIFFTEDKGFIRNFESLLEAHNNGEHPNDKEIAELCKTTVPCLSVELAY